MSSEFSGVTDRFGFDARYEYRCSISARILNVARLAVEVRFMPSEPLADCEHEMVALASVGTGPAASAVKRVAIPWTDADSWSRWVIAFDAWMEVGPDANAVSIDTDMGRNGFPYRGGVLRVQIPVAAYPRPDATSITLLEPRRIDVSAQDSTAVSVSWEAVANAAGYRVYVNSERSVDGARNVSPSVSGTAMRFNPKTVFSGQTALSGGTALYIGVEPYDSAGVPARRIAWSPELFYTEVDSIAPTDAYVIGGNGERNEVAFDGERSLVLRYSGESDGSYAIARLALVRQDGVETSWSPADASSDGSMRSISLDFPGWDGRNELVGFELRAYDLTGNAVFMPNGEWFSFDVLFYGGIAHVYDGGEWNRGITWVFDGGEWRRALAVSVYAGGWKSS